MANRIYIFTLIAIGFLGTAQFAEAQSEGFETFCVIRELDEVELPAKRDGLIESLNVRRGKRISKGQLIGQLENTDIKLRLKVSESELDQAQVRAKNVGAVNSAKADVDRADQEFKLLMQLGDDAVYLEKFRMRNNLARSIADLDTAKNQLHQDQLFVQIKSNETNILRNDIEQTKIKSPVNGVIKEMLKNEGEWVQRGEPILIATRMDRLLAEGFLDSKMIAPHSAVGTRVVVSFEINNRPSLQLEGLVVRESTPKLELDGKYPVWVEFNNQMVVNDLNKQDWLIRPGMRAKMKLHLPSNDSATTAKSEKLYDSVLPVRESSEP